jgi:hypothetical protein
MRQMVVLHLMLVGVCLLFARVRVCHGQTADIHYTSLAPDSSSAPVTCPAMERLPGQLLQLTNQPLQPPIQSRGSASAEPQPDIVFDDQKLQAQGQLSLRETQAPPTNVQLAQAIAIPPQPDQRQLLADRLSQSAASASQPQSPVVQAAVQQPKPPEDEYEELRQLFLKHASQTGQGQPSQTSGNRQNQFTSMAQNNQPAFDPSVVSRGQQAFESYCTQCHDANRAMQKSKSLSGWRATVQRMAGKDGADIPSEARDSIATYLASRSSSSGNGNTEAGGGGGGGESSFSVAATISPMWRGGGNSNLQNPGFFPMTWVGAAWQGSGPISGRATACISCHNELVSRLELVEGCARFDLRKCLEGFCCACDDHDFQASAEAGRFIVPFGAFYQQVNPGVYRTVTVSLIYNMGQRVYPTVLPVSVLPMPYADEGAAVNTSVAVTDDLNATFSFYGVNGLQGFNDLDFILSREYVDNNRSPAIGGRVTAGTKNLKVGASITGGPYNQNAGIGPNMQGLNYLIYGADCTYRWEDIFRIQFEYAQRDTDIFLFSNNMTTQNHISGCYLEEEVLLHRCWHLSFVSRYDFMGWRLNDPSGQPPTKANERVLTLGLNWALPGGSLLMIGDDHWYVPGPLRDVDVVGFRWATTF